MGKDKGTKKAKPVDDDEQGEVELEEDDEVEEEVEEADGEETEAEDFDDEAESNGKVKKGKKKGGKGSGLVPREPIVVPKDVLKAQKPEIQKLLKLREKQQAEGDKKGLRKTRQLLRKEGFRLSKVGSDEE